MKIIIVFTIISLILVIPPVNAQGIDIGEKAKQKLVEMTISKNGDIHVKHVVGSSKIPRQVDLIDGTIQNLTITDEDGKKQLPTMVGDGDAVLILPSSSDSTVEYQLEDTLLLKDNIWTLDFLYLETTNFIMPEEVDLVFVNDGPLYLDDKKGFSCHGCQVILEYSFDEPRIIKEVNWEDKKFLVEIRTFADIEKFGFSQSAKEISIEINGNNQFVTTIVPLELLWGPYAVFLDDKKIGFQDYKNNGTHVWINMRPDVSGEITVIGTTVVPEFPIVAPLIIGFLIILIIPLIKRINLHQIHMSKNHIHQF